MSREPAWRARAAHPAGDPSSSGPVSATRWLWGIVAAGAVLRLFPIWFALEYPQARPDEAVAIDHASAALAGELNPRFFHWPSLTFYAFAAVFGAASGVRAVIWQDGMLEGVERVVIARAVVALAGTLTIVVLFSLARRAADTTTGLLAAAFLAVAILHVRESHFAMTDVLMTLLVTTSLALLVRAVDAAFTAPDHRRNALGWFAAAGLAGGLATSTKYNAAAIIAAMGAAQLVLLRHQGARCRWRRTGAPAVAPHVAAAVGPVGGWPSLVFLLAFGGGFLVATPYSVLDYRTFAADLHFNVTHLSGGHGINVGRGWTYHLVRSLPYGTGIPTFLAAVAGAVVLVWHSPRNACLIGAFALAYHAAIGSGYTVFFRYVLPLVPLVCLLAAVAVRHAGPWVAPRIGLSAGAGTVLVAAGLAVPSLVNSVWFDLLLARADTRVLAARWLAPRLAAGESVHDSGGDYTRLHLGSTPFHSWPFDPAANSFGHPEGRTPDWLVLHQSPLRQYARIPAPLRRLAAKDYELVWMVRATRGAAGAAVYDVQDAFFMPVSGFPTVERPGPTILIYRRRQ